MDRNSSRRGAREDDQRKREEQGMLRGGPDEGRGEPRRGEAPGAGDEASLGMRDIMAERQGSAPSQHTIEDRAALASCFPPSAFPARRERLVAEAEALYADENLIEELRALPDATYRSVGDVWRALGWEGDEQWS